MSPQNHLTALALELQTHIFSYLQPYDILQVSQTCRALYCASLQREVWTGALHRICVQNTLFEPSFPVASMSVLELQRASTGPHRWIAKSSSKKRNSDGVLPHSVTRHWMSAMPMSDLSIMNTYSEFDDYYLVPGGRYLFWLSFDRLVLWDLGSPYESSGTEPHSVATIPVQFDKYENGDQCLVYSTPDGMGLRVFLLSDFRGEMLLAHIYEIYPQSISPQLTQIAYTQIPLRPYSTDFFSLSYDRLIISQGDMLTVWDYKANTWARWGAKDASCSWAVLATKFAVVLIYSFGIRVWKIPPLLPESSFSMNTNPPDISPDFVLNYPEEANYYRYHQAPCVWYSALRPLYFDVEEYSDAETIARFEVNINSEISSGTLNLVNTYSIPPIEDVNNSLLGARICQDKNVRLWFDPDTHNFSALITDIYDRQLPSFVTPLSCDTICLQGATICPATGRVVYHLQHEAEPSITVLDFL